LLKKKDEDVWLYFYEHFLAAYDPQLRKDRGAYYTPVPVIRCQCELVERLLQLHFKKELGFADKKVVLLDPAAGTGAYPLAAMQKGFRAVEKKFGPGAVGGYASQMAVNINAFEILVGPYAVAHLRLTQQVVSAGGSLPKDGIHVYLTDTLESPYSEPKGVVPLFQKPLAEEHRRARVVKEKVNVLVCIGNPPYDRQVIAPEDKGIERKGGWVRKGDSKHSPKPILDDFLQPARDEGNEIHLKNLYNDYVYFWRWALWKVLEQNTGPGIVSFITASSYLVGAGFVGMRKMMRQLFDELWLIDLEGSTHDARKTENVFNIQVPVVIAVGVRYGQPQPETPAIVHYSRITGTRDDKYTRLNAIEGFSALSWQDCPAGWTDVFMPVLKTDYKDWPKLTDIFPWQTSGVQVKRKWPIAEVQEVLVRRWESLVALPFEERAVAFHETRDRKIGRLYRDIVTNQKLPSIASLESDAQPMIPVRYGYRSFDRQWIFPDNRLADFIRPSLWSQSDSQLYLVSLLTKPLGDGPAAMVSVEVPDLDFYCNRGAKDVIPLYRDKDGHHANINHALLESLQIAYGAQLPAEDVFAYCYSILASPSYTKLFAEPLRIPGPRVPFTKDKKTFEQARDLGKKLINVHTFGEGMVPSGGTRGLMPTGAAKCVKGISGDEDKYPNEFSYDEATQSLLVGDGVFGPLGAAVWEYEISGFKPVQSWLGYRMLERTGRSSSSLDKKRPRSWTVEMTDELLQVLWTVERSLSMAPELCANLDFIIQSPLFSATELPEPGAAEQEAPSDSESDQVELHLAPAT
jgi:predicted helicase